MPVASADGRYPADLRRSTGRRVRGRPLSRVRGAAGLGAGPVDEATDHWLETRRRDVDALLRDRRFGRTYLHAASHEEMGRDAPPARLAPVLAADQPIHIVRGLAGWWCGSAKVRAMDEDQHDEIYRRGRERFLEIHDEKALRTVEGLGDLGRHIVEFVYGEMYTKPALTDRDRDRGGGALTKVLATLLVLALLASAALFVYTRSQDPLAVGVDASVGYNAVLADHGTLSDPLVKLEPNGQIYLATTVRNEGSLPI